MLDFQIYLTIYGYKPELSFYQCAHFGKQKMFILPFIVKNGYSDLFVHFRNICCNKPRQLKISIHKQLETYDILIQLQILFYTQTI